MMIKRSVIAVLSVLTLGWMFTLLLDARHQMEISSRLTTLPETIVSRMTLEEKVGQLFHTGLNGTDANPEILEQISRNKVGGIILFARNLGTPSEVRALTEKLQKQSVDATGIPLFISIDQEGGRVFRMEEGTEQFPGAMALGQTDDPKLAEESGIVTGYELREMGINMILAPVLDVNNNPDNPVINTRSFGSDPARVSIMGTALARGLRKSLSTPMMKHFPGHGDTDTDSHLALFAIKKDLDELRKLELIPFREAIDDGAEAIMSAHIVFRSLDENYPATLSPRILRGLLREELGYRGLIMTDAMEMKAISGHYSPGRAAKLAFKAGADIILLTAQDNGTDKNTSVMYDSLLEGFKSGELSVKDLDSSIKRQIALKLKRGIFLSEHSPLLKDELLTDYFEKRFSEAAGLYRSIKERYAKEGGLNRIISRESIVSLTRPFPGLQKTDRATLRLLYRTGTMREAAREYGLAGTQLAPWRSVKDLTDQLSSRKPGETWIVEVTQDHIQEWNLMIENLEHRSAADSSAAPTVALYTGNPFEKIVIPENGAVLASFSPTTESRKALLYRALHGPVNRADLILNEKTGPLK